MKSASTSILRFLAVVVLLGTIFSLLGVYDTDNLPFHMRFVFWTTTMIVGGGSGLLLAPRVMEQTGRNWPVPMQIAVLAALVSLPVTATLQIFEVANGGRLRWVYIPLDYLYVFLISFVITCMGVLIDWVMRIRQASEASPGDAAARFLERLPVKFRTAELHAIASEDHYLRIYTSLGEELILMRLADAVRDLSGADGLQVHRSWWVARAGVADSEREGGKLYLILKNKTRVPVSRTYVPAVRAAGLL